MENQSETGCCPRFNPEPWDEKETIWEDKLFIKDHVTSFLHIPLNFGKVMIRNMMSQMPIVRYAKGKVGYMLKNYIMLGGEL